MDAGAPDHVETQAAYKRRLAKTAKAIPQQMIQRAVAKMKAKAAEVVAAKGNRIPSD
jgi:hypothetical protein